MRKYTKQEVLDQRISFKPMTEDQYYKLCNHFGLGKLNYYYPNMHYRFYGVKGGIDFGFADSYLKCDGYIRASKEISFEEFDFEDEFVLPEY